MNTKLDIGNDGGTRGRISLSVYLFFLEGWEAKLNSKEDNITDNTGNTYIPGRSGKTILFVLWMAYVRSLKHHRLAAGKLFRISDGYNFAVATYQKDSGNLQTGEEIYDSIEYTELRR